MGFCSKRTLKPKQDGDDPHYVLKGLSDHWVPSRFKKSKNDGRTPQRRAWSQSRCGGGDGRLGGPGRTSGNADREKRACRQSQDL